MHDWDDLKNWIKKLKLSKYNSEFKIDNKTILYNIFSSGILLLNEDYTKKFNSLKKGDFSCDKLVTELRKDSMLIDEDIDEFKRLKVLNSISRFSTSNLSLTIAPTSACNFRCPYCYEEGINHVSMNEETKKDLIKFLEHYKSISSLSISWYGGEPLLTFNLIEKLTNDILNFYEDSINYSASMVTNGYLLTPTITQKLVDLKINHIQITLNGDKSVHDSRRVLADKSGTFDTIIHNIKECC